MTMSVERDSSLPDMPLDAVQQNVHLRKVAPGNRKTRNMSAIAITGMHRSGTSLLAEILMRAGVHFGPPEQWLPADESNPRGYFEDRRVIDLDDRLLGVWKGTWDEPPLLPPEWLEKRDLRALADDASVWLDSVATDGQWGWKDPRASLLLPFWRRL